MFLLWVSDFRLGADRWKHRHHSHRVNTHLPIRNVLAGNLPHKQAFEGKTDDGHIRANARWRTTWVWGRPGRVGGVGGQPVKWEVSGWVSGGRHYRSNAWLSLPLGLREARQKGKTGWAGNPSRRGSKDIKKKKRKILIQTTWFTLETTD